MPSTAEIFQMLQDLTRDFTVFKETFHKHRHGGIEVDQTLRIDGVAYVNVLPATIATTGNTDTYVIAPITGTLTSVDFSGVDALAASDTNYITWTITNLGQAGAGSAAMLGAIDGNTTKATGGTALSADTKRALTRSTTPSNIQVVEGDRLRIRAAVTNTLANTVTFPTYMLRFTRATL